VRDGLRLTDHAPEYQAKRKTLRRRLDALERAEAERGRCTLPPGAPARSKLDDHDVIRGRESPAERRARERAPAAAPVGPGGAR